MIRRYGALSSIRLWERREINVNAGRYKFIPESTNKEWIPFTQVIVALEIEEHFSNKKCFEYNIINMSVSDFGMNVRGIQEASEKFYKKKPEALNEREIIELSITYINPTLFNPFRNRTNLDSAVDNVMNKSLD